LISVVVVRNGRGNLVSAEASGHAGAGKRGTDIVCSAVTVLLRTTLSVLSASGVSLEAGTAGRGSLGFRVTASSARDEALLRYAADFLVEGIGSLERESPGAIEMRVDRTDD
jgi:uncharacterized protein YsxB (DUF464 family)